MNTVFIVLPILTLLMFNLGLTLQLSDFMLFVKRPRAILIGLTGQLICLPLIALALGSVVDLPIYFLVGLVLIACCPGGSSSNVFSMLAKGDVALSVSLTALSSVLTLFTLPLIVKFAAVHFGAIEGLTIQLPVGKLIMQNVFTMLVPILLGIAVRRYWKRAAAAMERVLSKIAFPALVLLATIFFVQEFDSIRQHIAELGGIILILLLLSIGCGYILSRLFGLDAREKRTIVIEVGMQNAAQAIALAASPFVFNDARIAIPAIIYALLMNVVLLIYVGILRFGPAKKGAQAEA